MLGGDRGDVGHSTINNPLSPEFQDVVEGSYVRYQRVDKVVLVALARKALADSSRGGSMVCEEGSSLREVLYGGGHAGFLRMTQLTGSTMGMMHSKVLIEVSWIED